MMTPNTIHFNNASEARDIIQYLEPLFSHIETESGLQLIERENKLIAHGGERNAECFCRFVEKLREARNRSSLTQQTVTYAYRLFSQGDEEIFEKLASVRIDVNPRKAPIFPKTIGQQIYLNTIAKNAITFGIGPAGTGKTYLAMAAAVSALLKDDVSRIVLTRPALEAGENLGYLPGDLQQKIYPYLRPLYDALHDMMPSEAIENAIERGVIEVAPLAYMRGRTLNHAFVILDEAQNTTRQQMLMFLTRLGFDSKCVITGDLTQVDLPDRTASGLLEAQSVLKDIREIAFIRLTEHDVVRHPLVQKVIEAYQENRSS